MLNKFILLALLAAAVSALNLPRVPVDFEQDEAALSEISDEIANKFSEEYIKYLKTGMESSTLKQLSTQLAKTHTKKDMFIKSIAELGAADQFVMCTTCRAVTKVVVETFRDENGELNGPNAEADAKKMALELCNRFKIQTPAVCSGLVDLNWPIIHYVIMNSLADTRSLCGTLPIKFCKVKQKDFNWSVKIDKRKGLLKAPKSNVPKKTDKDLNIVQITDIHFDPDYQPGGLAECEEPLCCRLPAKNDVAESAKAGYWSDYRSCDAPLHMVESALDHIKETHEKIDFIYQTGDIVPHNVWTTSKESNKAMLSQINDLMVEKFPDIPIYSCVGNHEPHPTNVFGNGNVPAELGVGWLYEHLWSIWKRWLPETAKETVLKGGYYTVSPKKGFRIIALNNNDCYIYNWWIYLDGSATSQPQLDWLQKTLLAAEKAKEHVHILAHIPSGESDCWTVWAREYNRIIERYSHIIGGIFGGHTHKDEMNLHYSENGYAMAIYWNAGSLTSYSFKNPNYRTYDVEPLTYQVVDHHTWIFNVTAANELGASAAPKWFKEYQFTEFTNDLSPAGIDALFEKMVAEPELLYQYWKYKMTMADPKLEAGCDEKCLMSTICHLVITVYDNDKRCKELQAKLKESLNY
ncbi:sphingomyelin phosphodiesterase 1-like [Cochliomyia hominivorax]